MKKMFLAAAAVVALLASCNKHTDEIADSATGSVVKISLTDKIPETTRAFFDQTAAAESWEKKINTLTLFIFDQSNQAVLQRNFTAAEISGQAATVPVPNAAPGQSYSFYVVANGSALSGVGTLDDLKSKVESEIDLDRKPAGQSVGGRRERAPLALRAARRPVLGRALRSGTVPRR